MSHEGFDDKRSVLGNVEICDAIDHDLLNFTNCGIIDKKCLNWDNFVGTKLLDCANKTLSYFILTLMFLFEADQNDIDLMLD